MFFVTRLIIQSKTNRMQLIHKKLKIMLTLKIIDDFFIR